MTRARIKTLAWTTLALLAAAWALPLLVRVNFWKSEIAAAFSNQLRRPVEIGDIHLQILGGLGVDVDNVTVAEDPAFGSEPFARVDSLEARLALSSIWRGRIEFSSLALSGASFNIVRNAAGNWNLATLGGEPAAPVALAATGGPSAPASSAATAPFASTPAAPVAPEESAAPLLPRIQIDSGRINFKSEDRKRPWCLDAVSLDLVPPGSPRQPWRFEFSALPTRTDIPFHATSLFRAEGEFGPFSSSMQQETGVPLRLDWSAENALLVDLLTIGAGRDLGVHGTVTLHGRVAGTSSLFRVSAESEIKELHRWDLFPNPAAPALRAELKGIVDLDGGSADLSGMSIPLGGGVLAVSGRAEDLFDHPRVSVDAELRHVPLDALAALGPQFTARLDRTASAEGTLDGALHADDPFGPVNGYIRGSIRVSAGSFQPSAAAPRLRFTSFDAALEGDKLRLGPLRVTPEQSGPLLFSGEWDAGKRSSQWRLGGDRIELSALEHAMNGFGITWSAAELTEGTAAIQLKIATVSGGARPRVTGSGQIFGAVIKIRGITEPLRIASARLSFEPGDVKAQPVTVEFGPLELDGNITIKLPRSHPAGRHPAQTAVEFSLDSPALDLQKLAALFSARPPSSSFFSFAGSDSSAPAVNSAVDGKLLEIVDAVPVTGTLRTAQFRYRGITLENVKASLRYQHRRIEIPEFAAEHSGGTERGMAAASFDPPVSFTLESRFANVDLGMLTAKFEPWKGLLSGRLSGSVKLQSSGRTLDEIVSRLSGSVDATSSDVVVRGSQWPEVLGDGGAAETRIASLTSSVEIGKRQIHVAEMKLIPARLPRIEAARALRPASWWITGDVGFDRSLRLTVQQDPEGGESHWAGTLAEPHFSRNISSATTARENVSPPAR